MSHAPGEQEMLTEIEHSLRRSDPGLAAMFAVFSEQIFLGRGPVREFLTPWRPSSRRIVRIVLLVIAVLCAVGVAAVIALTSHGGSVHGTFAPVSGTGKFPGLP